MSSFSFHTFITFEIIFFFILNVFFVSATSQSETAGRLDFEYLTHDWSQGYANIFSDLAKEIYTSQRSFNPDSKECKDVNNLMWFAPPNAGMGSDIHVWSQALCIAMQQRKRLIQSKYVGSWVWNDPRFCSAGNHNRSSSRPSSSRPTDRPLQTYFDCYFNEGDSCQLSENKEKQVRSDKDSRANPDKYVNFTACPKYIHDAESKADFRRASMEYLFSQLRPRLVSAADAAAGEVFQFRHVPRHKLITVHVRWGDKVREMKLVPLDGYMAALESIVSEHRIDTPFVYLTTETYEAHSAFSKVFAGNEKYANWTLLNYKHSLAGKGGVSGYVPRSPEDFPHAPDYPIMGLNKTVRGLQHRKLFIKSGIQIKQNNEVERRNLQEKSSPNSARPSRMKQKPMNRLHSQHPPTPLHARSSGAQQTPASGRQPGTRGVGTKGGTRGGRYQITSAVRAVSPMSLAQKGSQSLGRHSLIALLIAMEAKHFVLTTGSNWSRLINELRINVLEAKCRRDKKKQEVVGGRGGGNCTTMIDLMKGDSPDWRK